ncbi:MAG: winged helix-turn-helix domain-containing protein [Candidatus Cyclobacteriaceae bacterium M3_2C_046]
MNEHYIKESTVIPKYKKVVNYIIRKIKDGELALGEKLPSIIDLSLDLDVSKDTINKAYLELHDQQIIQSVPRRGYFVNKDLKLDLPSKVLLILSEVNFENKYIYDELVEKLNNEAELFTYCYSNTDGMIHFLNSKLGEFDYFILSPFNTQDKCDLKRIASHIPIEKQLYISHPKDNFQLFDLDLVGEQLFEIFQKYADRIKTYQRISLVMPENKNFHYQMIKGFQKFCEINQINYSLMDGIVTEEVLTNHLFFVLDNDDLFSLLKATKSKQFEFGYDIGVISLNEKPFKEFIGISTIQFNFQEIAQSFYNSIVAKIETNTFLKMELIDRKSF